jgi:two-component system, OmpR family, osmolarity sensor histidine kinase EnvZ
LIAYIFLRNQLRPITRLAEAATGFGRGRTLAYTPGGAAEVRAAGTAFLDMRARIERQAQTRTLMLSGVSHDLRTPLTRMRLALSLIDGEDARAMAADVDQMARMVDSFLDYTRDGASDPVELTDPVALVQTALAQVAGQVRLGAIEGAAAPVPLRPIAVRRAVDNLIGNALRHGTQVQVGLAFGDKSLRISVEDDGPGIPAGQRDDAMRPFVRLDGARQHDQGSGVGLGLTIVADIARAHGGVLRLGESAALGGLKADLVLAR